MVTWRYIRFLVSRWKLVHLFAALTHEIFFEHLKRNCISPCSHAICSIYYMANPVLGKSLCSDWFFLSQDFAVRTISMFWSEAGKFKICYQISEKKLWILSFFIVKLPEEAKKIENFLKFQVWMKTNILQACFIILKIWKLLMQKLKQASLSAI